MALCTCLTMETSALNAVLTQRHIIFFLTFRGTCIVIYSYNKSQRDALFLKFILIKNSTCFGQIYCPSSGVSAYTTVGICHASYVDCLLAIVHLVGFYYE